MARAEDGGRRPEQAHGPGRARDWTGQDGTQLLGGGGSAGGAGAGPGAAPPPSRLPPPPPPPARPAPCDPRRPRTKRRDGGAGRRPGWGRERASLGRANVGDGPGPAEGRGQGGIEGLRPSLGRRNLTGDPSPSLELGTEARPTRDPRPAGTNAGRGMRRLVATERRPAHLPVPGQLRPLCRAAGSPCCPRRRLRLRWTASHAPSPAPPRRFSRPSHRVQAGKPRPRGSRLDPDLAEDGGGGEGEEIPLSLQGRVCRTSPHPSQPQTSELEAMKGEQQQRPLGGPYVA
ncbi:proline-rich protein HaeIII subfamily 1 [Phocoena sinus]|uniref:proline-rich protein HaeIII subfamily 1 n=1 Tax=Phocoena sinus TaxID=42100 RepID=UPI0013C48668|nr:proline-rich protein HaeIII subfamily 1 [Phocoena sinus]